MNKNKIMKRSEIKKISVDVSDLDGHYKVNIEYENRRKSVWICSAETTPTQFVFTNILTGKKVSVQRANEQVNDEEE